ncbi:MAG: N-acetyltransferase [Bacteroidia bacterium]|jgi:uncharacterized protein|nr:N-acetyltransferase [Bacteroidia bacterium]
MKKDFRQAFNLRVQHNETDHKFLITLGGDEISVAYDEPKQGAWQITSVNVPTQMRSMNVHAQLLEYVLEHARQEKIEIIPTCAFAKSFIKQNPRFLDMVPQT